MRRLLLILVTSTVMVGLGLAQTEKSESPPVLSAAAPVYPQLAILSATGGDVSVKVKVNKTGQVISTKLIEGHKLLQSAALEAARRWRFEQGIDHREAQLVFSFRVMPKETSPADLTSIFRPPYAVEVRRTIPDIPPDYEKRTQTKNSPASR